MQFDGGIISSNSGVLEPARFRNASTNVDLLLLGK